MESALPSYVVVQSHTTSKYLSYEGDGALRFTGEDPTSPKCKFAIETSSKEPWRELFYIRCVYNNKYLVRADGGVDIYYVAEASTQDLGDLFYSVPGPFNPSLIQIFTVQEVFLSVSWDLPPPRYLCLLLGGSVDTSQFKVIDWESLVVLPKNSAFKGCNGSYLGPESPSLPLIQCSYNDIIDHQVANEITSVGDGNVFIQSKCIDSFWALCQIIFIGAPDIVAESPLSSTDRKFQFQPVKVGGNTVALRNLYNNLFCSCSPESRAVRPDSSSITSEATLTVEEANVSRWIYQVKFRINHARIYNEEIITLTTQEFPNHSPTESETVEMKKKYTSITTRTWDSSVFLKLGVSNTITSAIPFIGEGGIELSAEVEGSYKWGETHEEESEESEKDFSITVPPMTKVTASLVATRATCDVPFSYTQKELLPSGYYYYYDMDDGVFTGVNSYNFHYVHTQEPL